MYQDFCEPNRPIPSPRSIRAICRQDGYDFAAATINVSESGACLALAIALPEQQEVTLTLEGPEQPARRLGRVAWCEHVGAQWVAFIQFQKHAG